MQTAATPPPTFLLSPYMHATTPSDRLALFLRHQDATPIVFYLTSRISEDWAMWIQSHGGSVAVKPTDAQFVIFPTADFSPPEQMQLDAFKKRDVPTVRLPWLVRMRRLGCITSWTQWACDPAYHTEPLVEDQEVAVQLRMLGVDNIEDESVNLGEICKNLSRRFPHHPIEWFEEQLRGYRPDLHSSVPESPLAAVPPTTYQNNSKLEPTAHYLPTPTSSASFHGQSQSQPQSQSQSQSQLAEDRNAHSASPQSLAELFRTPRSDVSVAANEASRVVTPKHADLGNGREVQEENGEIVPGSLEDEVMSDGPMMGALSPNLEQPCSPISLEHLFRENGSLESLFGDSNEMRPLSREFVGIPPLPPRAATSDGEATAQLLHGIDNLSNWEPTPSIHSYSRRDCPPPTYDKTWGLWHNSNAAMERCQHEEDIVYKELSVVRASRVREEELRYGWELIREFIRTSVMIKPAQLGSRINRMFGPHGGRIDWVQFLKETDNDKRVRELRQEYGEVHWRARNPDAEADEEPAWKDKWFGSYDQAMDPATNRASPPELSDDELSLPRSQPKKRGAHTRTKRKKASGTRSRMNRRDGVLASSSSPCPSCSSGGKEGLSDSEWSPETDRQGRRKRRRFD